LGFNSGFKGLNVLYADPGGREVKGVGLRPLASWDYEFESRGGRGCLPLVSIVCCQIEVSASGLSFVQRSPTEYMCVCVCVTEYEQAQQ